MNGQSNINAQIESKSSAKNSCCYQERRPGWNKPFRETYPNMDKPYSAFTSCFIQGSFTCSHEQASAPLSTGVHSGRTCRTLPAYPNAANARFTAAL